MELERLLPIPLFNVLRRSIGRYPQQIIKHSLLRRHGDGAADNMCECEAPPVTCMNRAGGIFKSQLGQAS